MNEIILGKFEIWMKYINIIKNIIKKYINEIYKYNKKIN